MVTGASRGHNFPISVVEGGTEIVNDISADQSRRIYDGLVLFGEKGALSGFCIGFENESERSLYAEKFVKLSDVFRGPINLEKCAVCHG